MYIADDEQNLWNLALAANKVGDYRRAIALFNRISSHELAFINIALVLSRIGYHQQALPCLTRAIALHPSMVIAYHQRGICYYDLQSYEEACKDFEQALTLMNGEATMTFGMSDSDFVLRSTDILYNKGVSLIHRQLEEDGRALHEMGRALIEMSGRALETAPTSQDVSRLPADFLFDPPEKEWDSASTLTAVSTKSDMTCETIIPLNRYSTGSLETLASSVYKSVDEKSFYTTDRPTRKELNRAVGRDMVPQTTEISSLPCSGVRIPHGPLTGLIAYCLVVESFPRPKFIHFRRSVVTNFIVDNEEGDSIVPIETLKALGYPNSTKPGASVTLLVQGVPAKCIVGYPGEAGRLGLDFLTSGGLTSYFDTRLVAPVLYVSGGATGRPKRESIFSTFPKRLSFTSAVKLVIARLAILVSEGRD